jgi:hypothetical protein
MGEIEERIEGLKRKPACNSTYPKGGGSGSKDSFVGNQIWLKASILRALDSEIANILQSQIVVV